VTMQPLGSASQAIGFVAGVLLLLAGWLMLNDARRFMRCLALLQASLGTSAALQDWRGLEWFLTTLLIVAVAVKPHPSVTVARCCVSVMAGLLLAGIVAAV
jgi:hypothetical protein